MSVNTCILGGRLVRDPELRQLQSGVSVVNFTVAVPERPYKKNGERIQNVTFVPCEAWDSGAETIAKYFKKGDPIIIRASMKTDSWTKDGEKRSRISCRVEEFWFPQKNKEDRVEATVAGPSTDDETPF